MNCNFLHVFILSISLQSSPFLRCFRQDPLAPPCSMALLSSMVVRVVVAQRGESPWAKVGISVVSETGGKKAPLELLLAC